MVRLIALLVLILAGCARRSVEEAHPAPSSSVSREQAERDARAWVSGSPGRGWFPVAPTGSMVPTFDSRSILLTERVTAQQLQPNDLAVYALDGVLVCHRVIEARPDGVFFAGDSNKRSDGWIAPDRIRARVAGILYTSR